jgi:hypothetical protein
MQVAPDRIRSGDTVEVTYAIADLPYQFASGRRRFAEQVLGRSLRVTSEDGRVRRFQALPMHLIAGFAPDTVRSGRIEYRFRFPVSLVALVDEKDWTEGWLNSDSTASELFSWPPGHYTFSATLTIVRAYSPGDPTVLRVEPPATDSVVVICRAARLQVMP